MCNLVENCVFCDSPNPVDLSKLSGESVCANYLSRFESFPSIPKNRLRNIENLEETLKSLSEKTEKSHEEIQEKMKEMEMLKTKLACKKEQLEMLKKEGRIEKMVLHALAESIIKTETEKLQKSN